MCLGLITDSSKSLPVCDRESLVSRLKLAVAADGDLRGGGPGSSGLGLCAAVAGLGAARVARGGGQQVGVMVASLEGAVGRAFRGQEGRILLQPASGERKEKKSEKSCF